MNDDFISMCKTTWWAHVASSNIPRATRCSRLGSSVYWFHMHNICAHHWIEGTAEINRTLCVSFSSSGVRAISVAVFCAFSHVCVAFPGRHTVRYELDTLVCAFQSPSHVYIRLISWQCAKRYACLYKIFPMLERKCLFSFDTFGKRDA